MDALTVQLSELEMLKSMYPGELRVSSDLERDYEQATRFPELIASLPPLHYTIQLNLEKGKLEVSTELPSDYPATEPEMFVRCDDLARVNQAALNKKLAEYISSLERGEVCVYSAITWCQENFENFVSKETPAETCVPKDKGTLIRIWLYSHHIYSNTKRKTILGLAVQYNCTGFCLPGRPGIICMEGSEKDVMDMWHEVKSLNWKKLSLRHQEKLKRPSFTTFEEVLFEKVGPTDRHPDMGRFYRYLTEYNVGYMFKEYFGVDGQSVPETILD